MFCAQCGNQLDDTDKFCNICGKAIVREDDKIQNKCPNCGGLLEILKGKCIYCGADIVSKHGSSSMSNFKNELIMLENTREYRRSLNQGVISNTDKKIIDLIKNYPVPNTKEEIFEFFILATSNVNMINYKDEYEGTSNLNYEVNKEIAEAWKVKCDQLYLKARLVLDKNDFEKLEQMYKETKNNDEIKKRNAIKMMIIKVFAPIVLLFALGTLVTCMNL